MPRTGDVAQRARKRAMKVSLRTLQRGANVVGETENAEPIVEFGSIRLVLPEGANHFRHLVRCSRCGRETTGDPVLSAQQLVPPRLVFCDRCTLSSVDLAPSIREKPEAAPEIEPATSEDAAEPAQPEARAPSADTSPGAADLVPVFPSSPDPQRQDLREALTAGLAEARNELRAELERVGAEQAQLARQLREAISQVSAALANAVPATLEEHLRALTVELDTRLADDAERRAQALAAEVRTALGGSGQRSGQLEQLVSEQAAALEQLRTSVDRLSGSIAHTVTTGLEQNRRTLASDLEARLAAEWESRAQTLVADLGVTLAQSPEEQGKTLSTALEGVLRRQEERLIQLGRALENRFEQHWEALEQAVTRRFDDLSQHVAGQLAELVGDRLEQHLQSTDQGVSARLDQHRQAVTGEYKQLVDQLGTRVGERLEQHRKTLEASISGSIERRHRDLLSQLAVGFGQRLEQHRQSLAKAVEDGRQAVVAELGAAVSLLEEQGTKAVGGLAERVEGRLAEQQRAIQGLATRLESTMVNRLDQLRQSLGHDLTAQSSAFAEGMQKALAEVGTTDLSDALASVADLEARILAAEEEAARQLERVAERTSATGSMSMALLQATGERVLGSLAGLGTQLLQLRSDLALTQQEIVELRTDVDDLRTVAARPPAAPPPPPEPPAEESALAPPEPPAEESAPAPAKRPRAAKRPRVSKEPAGASKAVSKKAATKKAATKKATAEPAVKRPARRAAAAKKAAAPASKRSARTAATVKKAAAKRSTSRAERVKKSTKGTATQAARATTSLATLATPARKVGTRPLSPVRVRLATARRTLESGDS